MKFSGFEASIWSKCDKQTYTCALTISNQSPFSFSFNIQCSQLAASSFGSQYPISGSLTGVKLNVNYAMMKLQTHFVHPTAMGNMQF